MGNTLVVDAINGNDSTASVNGLPFLTVEAAITYISTYDPTPLTSVTVWVLPGTYTLASATTGLTIPATCSLRGLSLQTTTIQMNAAAPGGTVTLLTMGENTRVEDLTLKLNSTDTTTNLIGMSLPGTTSATSKLRTCVLSVNNSTLASSTTTNVYGVYSAGTGILTAATFSFNCLKGCTINVYSNGQGNKFGVYQPNIGAGNEMSTRDMNIYVAAPTTATSTGLYVGVYTENNGSQFQARSTSIAGSPYPTTNLKLPVVAVADSNITPLSGLTTTVDGVALNTAGQRVLLTAQTSGVTNGIYVVASGAWTRSTDMATGSSATSAYVPCSGGTVYKQTGWYCATSPGVVGTDALVFSKSNPNKLPVATVATSNITPLSGLTTTVEGVLLSTAGQRVLLTAQTGGVANGIYVVASGAWTRSIDMEAGGLNSATGAYTFCNGGTYTHTGWRCPTSPAIIGTDALTFSQVYAGSDILQNAPQAGNGTNGIQLGPGTDLVTKTAATHPFTTYVTPTTLQFCLNGDLTNDATRYLWPGTLTISDATQVFYRFQQKSVVQGLFVNLRVNPDTVTVTVLLSTTGTSGSGTPTLMTVTLGPGVLSASNYLCSVDFQQFNYMAIQVVHTNEGGGASADMVVEVDIY
jgi:hypothetical protein